MMYSDHFDLAACMACGGTMKCVYCRGSGERRSTFFKRRKTCNQCHGTGACPFCMGDKKSWALETVKKWMPEDFFGRSSNLRHKEIELRREFVRLKDMNIPVKSLEEFSRDAGYQKSFQDQVRFKVRIRERMVETMEFYEQVINEYELYLKGVNESLRLL